MAARDSSVISTYQPHYLTTLEEHFSISSPSPSPTRRPSLFSRLSSAYNTRFQSKFSRRNKTPPSPPVAEIPLSYNPAGFGSGGQTKPSKRDSVISAYGNVVGRSREGANSSKRHSVASFVGAMNNYPWVVGDRRASDEGMETRDGWMVLH